MKPRTKELAQFIFKREDLRIHKEGGSAWPWTTDPILSRYRFCNVRRNDDKQTRLIHQHWLKPLREHQELWFAMVVARLVNWWPSLEEVGVPIPWKPERFKTALAARKRAGEKVFTGAYMVRADAVVSGSKADYLADYVLTPLWEQRKHIRPRSGDTLDSFHQRLTGYRDMGSFMAAQVIADTKYGFGHLGRENASDWSTWAASGPGSRRGLARVLGFPTHSTWDEHVWREHFAGVLDDTNSLVVGRGMSYITGQDLQNCLCEFDKYERVRLGEGRPRSLYKPHQ